MKKTFIFALVARSSLAVNLLPFHNNASLSNAQLTHNSNLYQVLNAGNMPSGKVTTMVNHADASNCYDLNTLIHSYSNFTLSLNNQFLAKKLPMTKNKANCDYANVSTDIKSILSAKMALAILDKDRKYKIIITDYAGQNIQPIVISNAPITSLSWNNANNRIAYVSYEAGKPVVYVQNIYTAQRYIVSNFDGSNSSPAFDGDFLLVSLSKDYGTHIYKIDLSPFTPKKTAIPLITSSSIDTEADYANGNLIFTSNKGGAPDVYLKHGLTPVKRISVSRNNITGRISANGSKILYVHGSRGRYDLMAYNLNTANTQKIDSGKILSGSFAPDNNLIAYIKNNSIVLYNLGSGHSVSLVNLKYKEIFDVKWSK